MFGTRFDDGVEVVRCGLGAFGRAPDLGKINVGQMALCSQLLDRKDVMGGDRT